MIGFRRVRRLMNERTRRYEHTGTRAPAASNLHGAHILVVTQYYKPEKVRYPSDLAEELASESARVLVLSGYPNYPEGRVFPGYKQKWRSRETVDGAQVQRVPLYANHSQSMVKRTLNYVSFALSSAIRQGIYRGADVTYVYATQLTAALGPWLSRLRGGSSYVLHIQDLWPDSVVESSMVKKTGLGGVIEATLKPWIDSVYEHAARIVVIAPTMKEILVERGVPESKISVIYNWGQQDGESRARHHSYSAGHRPLELLFAGNLGDMQDLDTVVQSVAKIPEDEVRLTLVGAGTREAALRELAADLHCRNISFEGPVAPSEMPKFYANADFALVTLKDTPAFKGTIPSKFQAALAYGLPVITNVEGDVARLVRSSGCGFVAKPEDVDNLTEAIAEATRLSRDEYGALKRAASDLFESTFEKDQSLSALINELNIARGEES